MAGKTYFFSVFTIVLLATGLAAVANRLTGGSIGTVLIILLTVEGATVLVLGLALLAGPQD